MGARVLILGASFAGLTAALELRRALKGQHDVLVVADRPALVFQPSLIWVPFGLRSIDRLTFPVDRVFEEHGVSFLHATVSAIDLAHRTVIPAKGTPLAWDRLLIATGARPDWGAVPGLGPGQNSWSIFSAEDAFAAGEGFERLVRAPGPVVIGGVPGAGFLPPSYEFALNLAFQLRKRGLAESCPITFVTPEPFVGHLGTAGNAEVPRALEVLLAREGITAVTNAWVKAVLPDAVVLNDGREFPSVMTMLSPPLLGSAALTGCPDITDAMGFVCVDDTFRAEAHPDVFAAGAAVAVGAAPSPVPVGVFKSGHLSELTARVTAKNLAASLEGRALERHPLEAMRSHTVIDAGDTGLMISSKQGASDEHAWVLPGPEAHWAKLAAERFELLRLRRS